MGLDSPRMNTLGDEQAGRNVAEIVDPDVRGQAGIVECSPPNSDVEPAAADRLARWRGEHQSLWLALHVAGQMGSQPVLGRRG